MMLKNSFSKDNVENIILRHSKRGMNVLRTYMEENYCERAVSRLLEKRSGTVFIVTGFYVAGYAETDGPVGTYFLAKALKKIGYRPVILTDKFCEGFFEDMDVIYLPIEHNNDETVFQKLLKKYKPVCCISIERCGRTEDDDYKNMRGISIKENTSPIDRLFQVAGEDILTIGIGDGGNEIGMGNLYEVIKNELEITPTVIKADELVIATVSNWGAYGIIAYLQKYTRSFLLPMISEVKNYIKKIIDIGSVDGVTKEKTHSVDGFSLKIEQDILDRLHQEASLLSFNHFTMSRDYSDNSRSQFSIGERVIDVMLGYTGQNREARVLDIGCGPGNLTNTLFRRLNSEGGHFEVSAFDIDRENVELARGRYPQLRFEANDIYAYTDYDRTRYDYIFSNETLHWMPKLPLRFYNSRNMIYYFFNKTLKTGYRRWALSCCRKSFVNIRRLLKRDGLAFLQFGLDGQLEPMYRVINRLMNEYFYDKCLDFKLPLYYPTQEEVVRLCEKCGFEIVDMVNIREPLFEKKVKDILYFLKAFLENNLILLMGENDTKQLFRLIEKELTGMDLKEFIKDQWNHVILIIRRIK